MSEPLARVSLFRTRGMFWLGVLWALWPLALMVAPKTPRGEWTALTYVVVYGWGIVPLAMLALALWRNRAGFAAWSAARRFGNALLLLLEWPLWAFGFLIPGALLMPAYGDYSTRAKVSEVLLAASSARTTVTENAQKENSLARSGEGVSITPGGKVSVALVAQNGTLVLYSAQVQVLATLTPSYKDGQVSWNCDVYPPRFGPMTCRTDGSSPSGTSFDRKLAGTASVHAERMRTFAAPIQAKVAEAAAGRASLRDIAPGRLLAPRDPIDYALLDPGGTIVLYSDRHAVFMLLEPSLKEGKLAWRCRLWPQEAKAAGCENPPG